MEKPHRLGRWYVALIFAALSEGIAEENLLRWKWRRGVVVVVGNAVHVHRAGRALEHLLIATLHVGGVSTTVVMLRGWQVRGTGVFQSRECDGVSLTSNDNQQSTKGGVLWNWEIAKRGSGGRRQLAIYMEALANSSGSREKITGRGASARGRERFPRMAVTRLNRASVAT